MVEVWEQKFYLVGEVGEKAFPARDTLAARAVTGVSGVNGLRFPPTINNNFEWLKIS